MYTKKLFENNEKWRNEIKQNNPNFFKDHAKGQTPKVLYIGCSDSRVVAEKMMGLDLGELFVHRNIANMVIDTDLSVLSVIEYAVVHLKVEHIAVCGHYECGGVNAALSTANLGLLNPWLRQIKDVYRLHQAELDAITDERKKHETMVQLNVREQCINLTKIAEVQKAMAEGKLQVHGWVFDISEGQLIDLKFDASATQNDRKAFHIA